MERVPYIDEHSTCVGATPERTWAALMAVGGAMRGPAGPLGWLMGLQGPDGTRVRARSWRAFPGVHGRSYRAVVVGSGAHRMVVRRLLRRIEGRACSA
jgi:hypothetical protein